MKKKEDFCCGHSHCHSREGLWPMTFNELVHHLPYSIFSVAMCLSVLALLNYTTCGVTDPWCIRHSAGVLFHCFHFLHIVFAATGSMICFFRFSKNLIRGIFVGIFTTMVFCTLSDMVLPYLAGRLLGVQMNFHVCFFSELRNVVPFLCVGLLNGLIMGRYHNAKGSFYSVFSHFIHILISSFASTFYIVSHGLINWYSVIGMLFVFLVIAVVVPCTLSDVVVPIAAARAGKKNERN